MGAQHLAARSKDVFHRGYLMAATRALTGIRTWCPAFRMPRVTNWARGVVVLTIAVMTAVTLAAVLAGLIYWAGFPDRYTGTTQVVLAALAIGNVLGAAGRFRRHRRTGCRDAQILTHAGWDTGQVFVSREVLPAVASAGLTVAAGALVVVTGFWLGASPARLILTYGVLTAVVAVTTAVQVMCSWHSVASAHAATDGHML